MTRKTTLASGHRSHKSDVAVQVRWASSVSNEQSSLQPYRCSQCMSDNSFSHWRVVVYTETICGGQLSGENGKFASPNFPNYYPPRINCHWTIKVNLLEKREKKLSHQNLKFKLCHMSELQVWLIFGRAERTVSFHSYRSPFIIKVPPGKVVKVTFKKFLLFEPGQENIQNCPKDYVSINEKK